ncbi:pectin lyase-like protein [Polyplosphaeria fusca]|uniref:Pectin lyase-like protein n=1 Tax=Polyplosphaeria fusca TaxID=682080 RepID=A0A9P4R333_9PLEO|nr:pectin lyase-like protein [Polyplosphaeria fusca]
MKSSLSCISALLSVLPQVLAGPSVRLESPTKREPCTVFSAGFETVDDAPAINDAITKCGNGGTIVLPSDQIYTVLSPITFAGCNGCDVQLEGQIWFTTTLKPFDTAPGYISMMNIHGAKFRSLTGKGIIDGHASQAYQESFKYDWGSAPAMLFIAGSSDIEISGIHAKEIIRRFYRVDKGSSNIRLSNLNLTIENQWYDERITRNQSIGFHIQESSFVSLTDINVDFRSNNPFVKVGVCAGISWGVSDITIRNIYCNAGDGAVIQFGSGGEYPQRLWNVTAQTWDTVHPLPEQQFAHNILIQNYTANSSDNSGFQNLLSYDWAKVTNLTYDGVNIVQGTPMLNDLCWVVLHTVTGACSTPSTQSIRANFSEIWFKNYRGKAGKPQLGCFSSNCTCDFHFEGWQADE